MASPQQLADPQLIAEIINHPHFPPPPACPPLILVRTLILLYSRQFLLFSGKGDGMTKMLQYLQFEGAVASQIRSVVTNHILSTFHEYASQLFAFLQTFRSARMIPEDQISTLYSFFVISTSLHLFKVLSQCHKPLGHFLPPTLYTFPHQCQPNIPALETFAETPSPSNLLDPIEQYLRSFPICTTLYSLFNQMPQSAWTGEYNAIFTQYLALFCTTFTNMPNSHPQLDSSPLSFLTPPSTPLPQLSIFSPLPPFYIFNSDTAQHQLYPTVFTNNSLFLRDVVYTAVSTADATLISNTEALANFFGINQYYIHTLGISRYLTIHTNELRFNQIDPIPSHHDFLAPRLYFTLLPSNIRYAPLILGHARMGFLEGTHFATTDQLPIEGNEDEKRYLATQTLSSLRNIPVSLRSIKRLGLKTDPKELYQRIKESRQAKNSSKESQSEPRSISPTSGFTDSAPRTTYPAPDSNDAPPASTTKPKKKRGPSSRYVLHPFHVFAPTSITFDDILKSSISSTTANPTNPTNTNDSPQNCFSPTNDQQPEQHNQSDQTIDSNSTTQSNTPSSALLIPHITVTPVVLHSVWGRIQQNKPSVPTSIRERAQLLASQPGDSAAIPTDTNNDSDDLPPEHLYYDPLHNTYTSPVSGHRYDLSLLPGQKTFPLPAMVQPNPQTTLVGSKNVLTSMLSRFSIYSSGKRFQQIKPRQFQLSSTTTSHPSHPSHPSPQLDCQNLPVVHPSDNSVYPWQPETYCLPQAYPLYLIRLLFEQTQHNTHQQFTENSYTATSSPSSWILKPSNGSCGRGIRILTFTQSVDELINKTNQPTNPSETHPDSTPASQSETNLAQELQGLITPQTYHFAQQLLRDPSSAHFFIHPTLLNKLDMFISDTISTFALRTPIDPTVAHPVCPWCAPDNTKFVVSAYISPPYLLKDRKFDLRIYVAVSSLSPLVASIHRLALVRVCTEPYDLESIHSTTISQSHPTDQQTSHNGSSQPLHQVDLVQHVIAQDVPQSDNPWSETSGQNSLESTIATEQLLQSQQSQQQQQQQQQQSKKSARLGQLTNFSLNKYSKSFEVEDFVDFDGSYQLSDEDLLSFYTIPGDPDEIQQTLYANVPGKCTISRLLKMLNYPCLQSNILQQQQHISYAELFTNIGLLVTRTLIAIKAHPTLMAYFNPSADPLSQPFGHTSTKAIPSASLLGFDVMIDSLGQCWLAEINTAPSLDCDAYLDQYTKTAVVQQFLQQLSVLSSVSSVNIPGGIETSQAHPDPLSLLHTPPSQWPRMYLNALLSIELQTHYSQGFYRISPSKIDAFNSDFLLTSHVAASLRDQAAPDPTTTFDLIVDPLDQMVQLWKLLPEDQCLNALNQHLSTYTLASSLPTLTVSSIHGNHPTQFHPFAPQCVDK